MARGSVNKVILIGTLGRDPESRYMPNGSAVCNISLATDEGYNDKNTGQRVDRTEWHRVVAYGRLAEIMAQYLKKGSKAYVEGRLQTREWEKDGIKRYSTEIVANEMTMLDSRQSGEAGYSMMPAQGAQQPMNGSANPAFQNNGGMQQQAPVGYGQAPQQAPQTQQPAGFGAPQQVPNPAQPAPQNAPMTQPATHQQPQQAPAGVPSFDDFDDDIPF